MNRFNRVTRAARLESTSPTQVSIADCSIHSDEEQKKLLEPFS
jgi:hypothetical protein